MNQLWPNRTSDNCHDLLHWPILIWHEGGLYGLYNCCRQITPVLKHIPWSDWWAGRPVCTAMTSVKNCNICNILMDLIITIIISTISRLRISFTFHEETDRIMNNVRLSKILPFYVELPFNKYENRDLYNLVMISHEAILSDKISMFWSSKPIFSF